MNKIKLLIVPMSLLCVFASAQVKTEFNKAEKENSTKRNDKVNAVSISIPFIWNKTTIFNSYSGARAKNITGEAISNGINLNYSRTIYKSFFAKVGVGYFKQKFGIQRPFDFEETGGITTNLLYHTKYYAYHNIHYSVGIGYCKPLNKKYSGNFLAVYNFFNTYKQEFDNGGYTSVFYGNPQVRKEKYAFGNSVVLQAGLSRHLYKRFGIGLDVLLPIFNKWRKDAIFREDTNEFYGSNLSIGTSLNFIYQLN